MDNKTEKNTQVPFHYWTIHKREFWRLWNELSFRQREIVSHDASHETETYQRFTTMVRAETDKRFNDPSYPLNESYTFKDGYREDVRNN